MRITTNEEPKTTTMKLEGRVAGAWVDECFRAWQELASSLEAKELRIDLRGVTFVDRSGTQLLAEIYRRHKAQFLTSTPLTKYFAESAVRTSAETTVTGKLNGTDGSGTRTDPRAERGKP